MDSMTATMIAAILADVPKGVSVVANDAYQGLKTWAISKWQEKHKGEKNKLEKAIENVEDDPKEQGYVDALSNQIAKADLANDPKTQALVSRLAAELQKMGAIGAKFTDVVVKGDMTVDQAIAEGRGSTGLEFDKGEIGNLHLGKVGATTLPK